MKKIAIIGANGYICRNLLKILNEDENKYEVSAYDRLDYQIDGYKNYKKIDILDIESLKKIDFNVDIIFMFAGKTGTLDGFESYNNFIDINEKGLLNVLNEYRKQNSKAKIIFPSTRLVYKGSPYKLLEDSEKSFKTIYAINKYSCEKYLELYNKIFGINYCIFRICVPYGTEIEGASSYGTIEFMLKNAKNGKDITIYGDGMVRRSIIHIKDLCNILIAASLSNECNDDTFNIGGEDYSLKEMAEIIAKKYNIGLNYIPYPPLSLKVETGNTVFDDSKLRKIINFKYTISFNDWCK